LNSGELFFCLPLVIFGAWNKLENYQMRAVRMRQKTQTPLMRRDSGRGLSTLLNRDKLQSEIGDSKAPENSKA
jgi:hypothetical protein